MLVPKVARAMVLAVSACLCTAAVGAAQEDRPLPSEPISVSPPVLLPFISDAFFEQRLLDVEQWTRDYEEWKAWFAKWHNRREPGWFSTRARRQPPEPPAWLGGTCEARSDESRILTEGCRAWREWERGNLSVLVDEQVVQTRSHLESPEKSVWWQHVHVDALWPLTQAGGNAFGVAGMHATIPVTHRMQVFIAPGMILMRLPSGNRGQRWSAATDWGFSYRMFDFKMPALGRPSTLHFNIARVWLLDSAGVPGQRGLYLAGFSVTFKPRPRQADAP